MNRNLVIIVGKAFNRSLCAFLIFSLGLLCYSQTEANGLPSSEVFDICQDHSGRIWFATRVGISCYDGFSWKNYTTTEGLVGQETNRAAGIVDSKDRVWIGANLGISFIDEKALRFQHKLAGFDTDWLAGHLSYDRTVRYTKLSPGSYRFHLNVKNPLTVWSKPVISPEPVIPKPFYFRFWFFILSFTSLSFFFYMVFRFFTQQHYAALLKKRVEDRTRQLHAAEKKYSRLFEEAKDVVFISTPEGKLIDINPAGIELFGLESKDEVLHETSSTELYYEQEDRIAFRKKIEEEGYVRDYELILKTKSDEKITALVTATLVRNNQGAIVAYRGTIRDISDKRQLEQQLAQSQKMEAIGTLAGGIAHDFNNLLSVIMGNMEMMLDDLPEGTEMHHSAGQVALAATRAAGLVKQILTFSRQSEHERVTLKLSSIVNEALNLLRASLPAGIEIRQNLAVDSGNVLADVVQIHQVVMNLCANAAFAMREKGGELNVILDNVYLDVTTVKKYNKLKPGDYLRLTVSDMGQGIPRAAIKRIFEPYFTTKKTGEGTGMGLAVVHGIVKSHRGDITVYSEPEKGTTFQVFFPRVEATVEDETGIKKKAPGGSENILFVDDEVELVRAVKKMLARLGYKVVEKTGPIEALAAFRKEPDKFDLLITDLTMPKMTGFELAEAVRRIRPAVPIIFCSGFSAAVTEEQIENYGMSNFVMKPIIKNNLALAIRSVLDKKE